MDLAGLQQFPSSETLYDLLDMFAPGEDMFGEDGIGRLASVVRMQEDFVRIFFKKGAKWKLQAQRVLSVEVDLLVQTVYGQHQAAPRRYNFRNRDG